MITIRNSQHLARLLKYLRERQGITRRDLAGRLFVSPTTVANRERFVGPLLDALGYDLALVPKEGGLVSEPTTIHASRAELHTELFWALHIDPVAREHGMEPPTQMLQADLDVHQLHHPDGRLLLIVRTDREDA